MVHGILRRACWKDLFAWACGKLKRYRVSGESMYPVLSADDVVLVEKSFELVPGDLIVFVQPGDERLLVKQVRAQRGLLTFVEGLHNKSVDSRMFGPIRRDAILGRVVCRL
ncbi:S26 family signal peptidase [Candidatus Woesearchaeota archaeon]|nr:MAG: S26 family signal peptidase [Candidatus Woesearchaeota archaeon]